MAEIFGRTSNSFRHDKRLQETTEENTRDAKYRNKQEGSLRICTNKSEKEEGNIDDIRRQIKRMLKIEGYAELLQSPCCWLS